MKWIPVTDRLPDIEDDYICFWGNKHRGTLYFNDRNEFWELVREERISPTHWMPLPPPPEAECDHDWDKYKAIHNKVLEKMMGNECNHDFVNSSRFVEGESLTSGYTKKEKVCNKCGKKKEV